MVSLLISYGAKVNTKNNFGFTPLLCASSNADFQKVRYLILKGADINSRTNKGYNALLLNIPNIFGDNNIARYLISKGININVRTVDFKVTALNMALMYRQLFLATVLISRGADLNIGDKYGVTPLMIASRYGYKSILKLMLKKGVNINQTDELGRTALFFCVSYGHINEVKLLLSKGADVNIREKRHGLSVLDEAKQDRFIDIIKLLKAHGAR